MVKIHRIWFNTERMDREDHYKITLFSRPRVSIHVDEYIWSFIEENIVKPHKLNLRPCGREKRVSLLGSKPYR